MDICKLVSEPSLLCVVSSGDCSVQEKDMICQRRRVIRKKNHCSISPFPISEMFPPTQEETVWDVSCYHGDNRPRSLVWRKNPWPHGDGSLEELYEIGIWSLTQAKASFEPWQLPLMVWRRGYKENFVLCPVQLCLLFASLLPHSIWGRHFVLPALGIYFLTLHFLLKEHD